MVTTLTVVEAPASSDGLGGGGRRQQWLRWIFGAVVVVAAGTCAYLLYREFDDAMGLRAFGWAALFALAPVPLLGGLLWSLGRLYPEPWWTLAVAALWGALAATLISLHLNRWLAELIGDTQSISARSAVFVAPWTEEATKAAIVFALVMWRGHRFNGVVAGVVLGGLAGLGFAVTENVLYYGQFVQFQADTMFTWSRGFDDLFVWRGVKACFVHPMFTMCTGFGIGLVVRYRHIGIRILGPAIGFSVAALLHMGYNAVASLSTSSEALTAAYVGILIPTLVVTVVLVLVARRHERRAVAARLHDYTVFGWITAAQIPFIVEPRARLTARREASKLGKQQRRTVRDFQRCGIELGVLRDRMVRGVAAGSERARERELLDRLRALRHSVVLPGVEASGSTRSVATSSSW